MEISIERTAVDVVFGRIHTTGQTNCKAFPSAADAQKHVERLIRQKIAKGYVEVA